MLFPTNTGPQSTPEFSSAHIYFEKHPQKLLLPTLVTLSFASPFFSETSLWLINLTLSSASVREHEHLVFLYP